MVSVVQHCDVTSPSLMLCSHYISQLAGSSYAIPRADVISRSLLSSLLYFSLSIPPPVSLPFFPPFLDV